MTRANPLQADSRLDLVFERRVDVPRELVWKAWTTPEHLKRWFTPAPWMTVDCEIDLRPGGIFRTVMRSPEGQEFANLGCYLEVVADERLVWTNALGPGFRPVHQGPGEGCVNFVFTAFIVLAPDGKGTRYTATVIHGNEADRASHESMGFHDGWGKALDQLVALAATL